MTDLAVPRRPAMAMPPMPAAALLIAAHHVHTMQAKARSMQCSIFRNGTSAKIGNSLQQPSSAILSCLHLMLVANMLCQESACQRQQPPEACLLHPTCVHSSQQQCLFDCVHANNC